MRRAISFHPLQPPRLRAGIRSPCPTGARVGHLEGARDLDFASKSQPDHARVVGRIAEVGIQKPSRLGRREGVAMTEERGLRADRSRRQDSSHGADEIGELRFGSRIGLAGPTASTRPT